MAELPKRLAGAGTAAAMGAVRHGMGDALRLDEKRGHTRRKPMGFGFLGQKRLKCFRSRVRHA